MNANYSISPVNSSYPVYLQENNIHQNHIFFRLVGGKEIYDKLPTLDLAIHKEILEYTNEYPIMRCINSENAKKEFGKFEANTQIILVNFKVNGFAGTSLLLAKNSEIDNFKDEDYDLNGSPNLKENLQTINENRMHQRHLNSLYQELLTNNVVEGEVTDRYKGSRHLRIELYSK
ncbi:MAG: hypothetical protein H0V82_04585 [Candidatus Protochlamydia sp.]|nr:hypothetical protein [Candidatus Protochlamydia sp.]